MNLLDIIVAQSPYLYNCISDCMNRIIYIPEKALLVILIVFVSATTIFSGMLMLARPGGTLNALPLGLFNGRNFHDYFVPGFLFSMMAGNANLVALFYIIEKEEKQYSLAMAGSIILIVWVLAHMFITEQFHWLQVIYIGVGIIMLLLSSNLRAAATKSQPRKH